MSQIHLPEELIYKILDSIRNTETILNCRLVCKRWHKLLHDILIFHDEIPVEQARNIVYHLISYARLAIS